MEKLKLVYKNLQDENQERAPHIHHPWFHPWLSEFFDIEQLGKSPYYDPAYTVFVANAYHGPGMVPEDYWYISYIRTQRMVVLDNVFESAKSATHHVNWNIGNAYILNGKNWFWHHEAFINKACGYDKYLPLRNYKKLGLMPMHRHRYQRAEAVLELSELLDDMYWSYVDRGRRLPNDINPDNDLPVLPPGHFDRYLNTDWYDDTCLSVVVETELDYITTPFITEKTYKAIAYYHPFMVLGCTNTLSHLRGLGFETFDHLWDESYDTEPNWKDRLKLIHKNLLKFKHEIWPAWQRDQAMDTETQSRVQHNHDLFYNFDVVKKNYTNEIIRPILEYVKQQNPGKLMPGAVDAYLSKPPN